MQSKEVCEVTAVHEDVVQRVQRQMPELGKAVQIFKALADETRLKIAYALTLEDEMCVCDVASVIDSSVATASHHLRYLRDHSLAVSTRKGRMVYYALADAHVHQLVTIAQAHAIEGESDDDIE